MRRARPGPRPPEGQRYLGPVLNKSVPEPAREKPPERPPAPADAMRRGMDSAFRMISGEPRSASESSDEAPGPAAEQPRARGQQRGKAGGVELPPETPDWGAGASPTASPVRKQRKGERKKAAGQRKVERPAATPDQPPSGQPPEGPEAEVEREPSAKRRRSIAERRGTTPQILPLDASGEADAGAASEASKRKVRQKPGVQLFDPLTRAERALRKWITNVGSGKRRKTVDSVLGEDSDEEYEESSSSEPPDYVRSPEGAWGMNDMEILIWREERAVQTLQGVRERNRRLEEKLAQGIQSAQELFSMMEAQRNMYEAKLEDFKNAMQVMRLQQMKAKHDPGESDAREREHQIEQAVAAEKRRLAQSHEAEVRELKMELKMAQGKCRALEQARKEEHQRNGGAAEEVHTLRQQITDLEDLFERRLASELQTKDLQIKQLSEKNEKQRQQLDQVLRRVGDSKSVATAVAQQTIERLQAELAELRQAEQDARVEAAGHRAEVARLKCDNEKKLWEECKAREEQAQQAKMEVAEIGEQALVEMEEADEKFEHSAAALLQMIDSELQAALGGGRYTAAAKAIGEIFSPTSESAVPEFPRMPTATARAGAPGDPLGHSISTVAFAPGGQTSAVPGREPSLLPSKDGSFVPSQEDAEFAEQLRRRNEGRQARRERHHERVKRQLEHVCQGVKMLSTTAAAPPAASPRRAPSVRRQPPPRPEPEPPEPPEPAGAVEEEEFVQAPVVVKERIVKEEGRLIKELKRHIAGGVWRRMEEWVEKWEARWARRRAQLVAEQKTQVESTLAKRGKPPPSPTTTAPSPHRRSPPPRRTPSPVAAAPVVDSINVSSDVFTSQDLSLASFVLPSGSFEEEANLPKRYHPHLDAASLFMARRVAARSGERWSPKAGQTYATRMQAAAALELAEALPSLPPTPKKDAPQAEGGRQQRAILLPLPQPVISPPLRTPKNSPQEAPGDALRSLPLLQDAVLRMERHLAEVAARAGPLAPVWPPRQRPGTASDGLWRRDAEAKAQRASVSAPPRRALTGASVL
eukprot:TRINITY_DN70109_c0_g1_i1.p1 TRINITY_DN70109_c0_g1~~TRINITY_DN70109_c0_g1_i1.p1  ORF type:complete len:1040 (+),score=358.87 TRINITY_DN70109_c0_g1_i1:86-3205(+)